MKLKLISIAVLALASMSAAQAVVYTNYPTPAGATGSVLAPIGTTMGQIFTLDSAQQLTDWSFFGRDGRSGSVNFAVAAWDGTKAVGPALYSQTLNYISTSPHWFGASNINTNLVAGSYVAYVTSADTFSKYELYTSSSNGGLAGYLSNTGTTADPLAPGRTWYSAVPGNTYSNLAYSATFTAAAVPEPESYGLMLAGLGAIAFVVRRRSAKQGEQSLA